MLLCVLATCSLDQKVFASQRDFRISPNLSHASIYYVFANETTSTCDGGLLSTTKSANAKARTNERERDANTTPNADVGAKADANESKQVEIAFPATVNSDANQTIPLLLNPNANSSVLPSSYSMVLE